MNKIMDVPLFHLSKRRTKRIPFKERMKSAGKMHADNQVYLVKMPVMAYLPNADSEEYFRIRCSKDGRLRLFTKKGSTAFFLNSIMPMKKESKTGLIFISQKSNGDIRLLLN